jgi:long-chain acyl-CoA synthetase
MKEAGIHLAWDLFIGAEKWAGLPRFFMPSKDNKPGFEPIFWSEYAGKVKQISGYLISAGINVQDKVAILGQNSFNWCVSHLGIQSARGIIVPVYPASQPELLEYFLEHSDAKFLFCDSSFLPILEKIKLGKIQEIIIMDTSAKLSNSFDLPVTSFSEALQKGAEFQEQAEKVLESASPQDTAAIIYTSGTTGRPKGVMLTHANLQSSANDWISLNAPHIRAHAVDLFWLPLSHTFGSGSVMLGNRLGWQSYFVSNREIIEKMPEIKPDVFLSVPAYWEKIYNLINADGGENLKENFDRITGGRLTFGLSGGAGLKKEIKEGFRKIGLLIIEGYGLTECSPTLTMNRHDKFDFSSVGVPYPSVELKLDTDGEILAKGPNIFAGYYKDEKATRETFTEDGWFKTGDIGSWTEDGFLQIIDRKKEILVTSGGKNIPPQNIERLFQDDLFINHLVVYGDGKKYLTALITLNEEQIRNKTKKSELSQDELLHSAEVLELIEQQVQSVNKSLASYETIKKFWIYPGQLSVEDNLLTPSLKIRRKAIYERFKENLEKLY